MSENIVGLDLFGSGGHAWQWGPRNRAAKIISSPGIDGAGRMLLGNHERHGQIIGTKNAPAALLIGTGADQVSADCDLQSQIDAIEALCDDGGAAAWEDDTGIAGTKLLVESFSVVGHRLYGNDGTNWQAWQYYRCTVIDMLGDHS